jgi:PAS domain S-box-containing protein
MAFADLSLRWKLLIPFFLLSLVGTSAVVMLAFRSQQELILRAEHDLLKRHYRDIVQRIQDKSSQALALATVISKDGFVKKYMRDRDREDLLTYISPIYRRLREDFGVEQMQFHLPGARSFLRVHKPSLWGDDLSGLRPTILHAASTRQGVGGLERGKTGYSIRAVAPIIWRGELVGTVEVGIPFGESFVREFRKSYGVHLTIYAPKPGNRDKLRVLATTLEKPVPPSKRIFDEFLKRQTVRIWTPSQTDPTVSTLIGPIRDYSGRVVALGEIRMNREPFLDMLSRSRRWMALVGVAGILLAMTAVWLLVQRFIKPIREMVREAAEIVGGQRVHIPLRRGYELGMLSRALNNMIGYMEASRHRIREYAENLEAEVITRTKELRQSEERYRNLVQRVPLVVYQMKPDRTLLFANRHFQELFGVDPSQVEGSPQGFDRWISPSDRAWVSREFSQAMEQGREWVAEYQLVVNGRRLFVREHAVPFINQDGEVTHVDGILENITDQKQLQEKTLQAEELKTLGEVSARLAHEIRNPLTSIGGLSRRLLKSLPEDHPAREHVSVIINEVQRLERILQMILSYIQPFEIHLGHGRLDEILEEIMKKLSDEFSSKKKGISWTITEGLPLVPMDSSMMRRALENLCRHTLFLMDPGSTLKVYLSQEDGRVRLQLRYPSQRLSFDDLQHYFYPFLSTDMPDPSLMELPVSKIILHKHGALVRVHKEDREVVLTVSLPAASMDGRPRPPFEI